jgi:hypothetical protein
LEESFLRVYLDACALNRLTDDQSQARIRTESEAVQQVLSLILMGKVEWKASRTLEVELIRNPDFVEADGLARSALVCRAFAKGERSGSTTWQAVGHGRIWGL